MRGILTIAGRDLKSMFLSPLFYVVSGMCALTWSGIYYVLISQFAMASRMGAMHGRGPEGANIHFQVFRSHVGLVNFIMIMATAALTMRLFAEEKRQRTYDLLLTSPVNATQIVLGKFLAGIGGAWALVLISMLYPLATAFFVDMPWGPFLASYLGLALVVGCYVGVGIFASSLTESPVLAVVMSLIFNVALWFVQSGADLAENPTVTAVFEHISVGSHFGALLMGNVRLASLIFFVSVIGLYCFLTQRVVESSRWR